MGKEKLYTQIITNAFPLQVLSLPLARFVLDGGLSSDDLNVTGYSWKQVKGKTSKIRQELKR